MKSRMDTGRLNIGTYILDTYARTEKHIREIAECGIDFVVCMDLDRPALDLFGKYKLGAVVSGVVPGWWGGDGSNAGLMRERNPLEKYVEAARSFEDHPAVWGIDCGDEPSALDFPYYGAVIDTVERAFPNQFAYLNLYPNYASVAVNSDSQTVNQLGTPTYERHIEEYCRYVGTPYICYDFYMYSACVAKAYENLATVSDACLRTGRDMWIVLQVNSINEQVWISENQLRFQAYSAMAFGARSIIWACYTAGWWHNQVLDKNGEKTEQYEKLKKVNAEIRRLSEVYMKYRRVSTHFVGTTENSDLARAGIAAEKALDTGVFNDVHAENGGSIIVGKMISEDGGGQALFVCRADDPQGEKSEASRIRFTCEGTPRVFSGTGELPVRKTDDGSFTFELPACSGAVIA